MHKQGKGMTGKKHSMETRQKMSLSAKGRKFSLEHRDKLRLAKLGKSNTLGKHWTVSKEKLIHLGTYKGEKHWNWKGGVTSYFRKLRKSRVWKKWREAVFKRDNYTCLSCRKHGVYLHPHHINQFSQYPEYRFDVDNGVTLCLSCHYLLHKK